MEKAIICSLGTLSLSCYALIAQPVFNPDRFSMQVKEIIDFAKGNFKDIPRNYKLEGSISDSIINLGSDGSLSYRSVFAGKASATDAKALIALLTQSINKALGNGDYCHIKSENETQKEIVFRSSCDCNHEVIRLYNRSISGKNKVYIDIPNKKKELKVIAEPKNLDIVKRVKKIIVDKLGVEESIVKLDACFTDDLGADSLDSVELIMEFEKEFKVSINDEAAECIRTVGEAIAYLEKHVK